jgi:CRISPR-associated endoribonuclease Cas6
MRIHLKIKTENKVIPFNHQQFLVGTIHKWIGKNDEHGKVSLYSFSQLEGGRATQNGLLFEGFTSFFFSSYHVDLIKKLITGIQSEPSMFHGLTVLEIVIQEDPDLTARSLFFAASPIFIKRRIDDRVNHIRFNDPLAGSFLKETLQTKMNEAGIFDESLEIRFETSYSKAGTKMVTYNGVQNRANWCPVLIEGAPETKLFAWNVGLGNSTGVGFGAIK